VNDVRRHLLQTIKLFAISSLLGCASMGGGDQPAFELGAQDGSSRLSAGSSHTCAVVESGDVFCWGRNLYGQLGDGTLTQRETTPVQVSGLTGVSELGAGLWHTCALTEAGEVFCWGHNDHGQLGDGTTTDRARPVKLKRR
jgi:alpha-tubulin suppressor-like RCC1 family protein